MLFEVDPEAAWPLTDGLAMVMWGQLALGVLFAVLAVLLFSAEPAFPPYAARLGNAPRCVEKTVRVYKRNF